jgi:hypothetical protein
MAERGLLVQCCEAASFYEAVAPAPALATVQALAPAEHITKVFNKPKFKPVTVFFSFSIDLLELPKRGRSCSAMCTTNMIMTWGYRQGIKEDW